MWQVEIPWSPTQAFWPPCVLPRSPFRWLQGERHKLLGNCSLSLRTLGPRGDHLPRDTLWAWSLPGRLLWWALPSLGRDPRPGLPAGLEFERWLNATGPPLAEPDLSQGSSLTRPVEALFQLWTAEPLEQAAASASAIDISKWRTFQTALFLDRLLDGSPLPQGGSHSQQGSLGKGCGSSPALTCPPPHRGGDEPVQVLLIPVGLHER